MGALRLPARPGPRPRTSTEIPHRQLDQQPTDAALLDRVLAEALTWPHVAEQRRGSRSTALVPAH